MLTKPGVQNIHGKLSVKFGDDPLDGNEMSPWTCCLTLGILARIYQSYASQRFHQENLAWKGGSEIKI